MRRVAAVLLALAAAALAGPTVHLVDGKTIAAELLKADGKVALLGEATGTRTVPTSTLVSASFDRDRAETAAGAFNLYLAGGDRLRGTVAGDGEVVTLDGPGVKGLKIALERVKAVRFGRLMGGIQARYGEVFETELARGRDVVIVQRGTRPFPFNGRVLAVRKKTLLVRVGDEKKELQAHKVYGFVRGGAEAGETEGLKVRVHLLGGGRITLPLERIDPDVIAGGGATVLRPHAARIEFDGGHIAHLSDFDPIAVEEVALFGQAPRWRKDAMVHGGPLRLRGKVYARGIGVQARSRLEFVLGGRWRSFFAVCGIDDAAGREGDASFRVFGDGKLLKTVRCQRGGATLPVLIDVAGVDRLVLEALPGDSYTSDFCDWAEARVFNSR